MDSFGIDKFWGLLFLLIVAWLVGRWLFNRVVTRIRLAYIRNYRWPKGLSDRFRELHPDLSAQQTEMVEKALKQFFAAYLTGGGRPVSMPSQVVDDLWHEFILYTRDYQKFCRWAFGRFLHHTPSAALDPSRRNSNEGLRRVWSRSCALEGIDPISPRGLPLLFGIDRTLNISNGFHYYPNCNALRTGGAMVAVYCAAHFSDLGIDGSLAGFSCEAGGDSSGGWAGDGGGGDGGGGCGGD